METVRTNFLYLKKQRSTGARIFLLQESEDDDAECLILKDVRDEDQARAFNEDRLKMRKSYRQVSKVF